MRLAKLGEYRKLFYTPDSAPTLATLRAQIHTIPGGQIRNGRYYVDLDKLDAAENLHAAVLERQKQLAAHPLLEGLL